jgi:cytochrome c-type biogenesis protein CcmH/NrfF
VADMLAVIVVLFLTRGLPILLLVLVVVLWVRSGRSKAHARFKQDQADKASVGRLGE